MSVIGESNRSLGQGKTCKKSDKKSIEKNKGFDIRDSALGRTIIFLEGGDEKFTGTNNFFFSATSTNNFFFRQRFCKQFFFLRNAMLYYAEFYVTTLVLPLTE